MQSALQTFSSFSLRPWMYGVQRVFDDSCLGAGEGWSGVATAVGLKNLLQASHLRFPGYVAADLDGSVTHAPQYPSGSPLVMVRVKWDVPICVGGSAVDRCEQSFQTPSDLYIMQS